MTSSAVDAWGAWLALSGKKSRVVSNVVVAAAYAFAYVMLRDVSNDQWYLPAGLRFASLLITPFRLWPALFVGEIAALGVVRLPVANLHGLTWYYGSLFVAWPPVAVVVHQLRTRTSAPRIQRATDAAALTVAAIFAGEGASLMNKACTALLRPGAAPMKYSDLIVYSLGDIQGILLATFAVVLVMGARLPAARERMFRIEAACSVVIIALFTAALVAADVTDPATLVAARLALLIPAIALSLRHGWRGACVAAVASNVALFLTMPHQGKEMNDGAALVIQEVFTFVSWALFVLGARGTAPAPAGSPAEVSAGLDDTRATLDLERARLNSIEVHLREKALRAEAMHATSRGRIEPVIAILRKSGQSEAAMNLIGAAHVESTEFRLKVVDDIYPLTVERDGLSAALHSDGFLNKFGSAKCRLDITGNVHGISLETALSAYRVLVESIDYLLASLPSCVEIRMRCSTRDGRGHISIAITARNPASMSRSSVDTARLAGLRSRARAFKGSFHSRAQRIRVILVDSPDERPASVASAVSEAPAPRVTAD